MRRHTARRSKVNARSGVENLRMIRWLAESRESFPSPDPEEAAIYREEARLLLDSMPERLALVLWLRVGYGYTVTDMERITGKPRSTLCFHVNRAESMM